jgi:hypothetical protein
MLTAVPISSLAGGVVTCWQGTEMALAEGRGADEPRWEDPGIPFLQLINLDLQLDDGRALRLVSHIDDGSGFHGFQLFELEAWPALAVRADPTSIYRDRPLPCLPSGEVEIAKCRHDGPNAIVEMRFAVSGAEIRLLAAEVDEHDGTLRILEPDESVLLQVNGVRPSAGAWARAAQSG